MYVNGFNNLQIIFLRTRGSLLISQQKIRYFETTIYVFFERLFKVSPFQSKMQLAII